MTQQVRPIRVSTHKSLFWKPHANYAFAAQTMAVPVAAAELAYVATTYPLAVLDSDVPSLFIVLGLRPQQNLFVSPDGRWVGDYVPSVLRGYPFKLIATGDQFALAYDESSGLLAEEGEGEPFFAEDGEPSERIKTTLQFLINVQRGQQAVANAVQSLKASGVLEPWPLKIKDGEAVIAVEGLSRVSEAALSQISDTSFLDLRKSGGLLIAHAQLLSMANISKLGRLAQAHAQHNAMLEKQQEQIHSMFEPLKVDDEIDWDAMLKDD